MIQITLSSAMGNVDETDFDLWTAYVAEKIDAVAGAECAVDQARFGEAGEDSVSGATEEQRETIRTWLSVDGWNEFCGEEWTTRRAAHAA